MAWTVDSEDFDYRAKLTVNKDKISSTLVDKDVKIDLSFISDSSFWGVVDSVGGDLRVAQSDGVTRQALGIDLPTFSVGSETGIVWFKASSLSSATDTDFYLYWGNATAVQPALSDTYGMENVWTSEIYGRWSLGESGDATGNDFIDSTSNDLDGLGGGGNAAYVPTQTTGAFGFANLFDGINDLIKINQAFNIPDKLTTEALIYTDFANPYQDVVKKDDLWECYLATGSPNFGIVARTWHPSLDDTAAPGVILQNTWHYVSTTYENGGDQTVYVDGVSVANEAVTGDITTGSGGMGIGRHPTLVLVQFSGKIQEVRVSGGTLKQTGHFSATYENLLNQATFLTIGSIEFEAAFIPIIGLII